MTTGERIREARLHRRMTQKELGDLCGIAEPTIRRYELGRLNPKYSTICKIAIALDYDPGWFIAEESDTLSTDLQRVFLEKIRDRVDSLLSTVDPEDFFTAYGTYSQEDVFGDLWEVRKPLSKKRIEDIADELGTSFEYLIGFSDDPDNVRISKREEATNGEHQTD